jgi:pimeloyl-ACP methyl ester carboxylesterase
MSPGRPSATRRDETFGSAALFVEHHGPRTDRTIILVHGAPDRSVTFREVCTQLRDRHVVVYDRRGYGRSAGAAAAAGMLDHAKDLLDIVDSCSAPPVVVGHSFGANPTMLAATLTPGAFAAIGLWEPPLPWVDWWSEKTKAYNAGVAASSEPAADIEAMYRALRGDATWNRLPAEVQADRRREGSAFQVDMASELATPFNFEDVTVRALVGYGTGTSPEHAHGARWLAERLPHAHCQAIDDTGHFAPRTHPEKFAAFVRSVALLAD